MAPCVSHADTSALAIRFRRLLKAEMMRTGRLAASDVSRPSGVRNIRRAATTSYHFSRRFEHFQLRQFQQHAHFAMYADEFQQLPRRAAALVRMRFFWASAADVGR